MIFLTGFVSRCYTYLSLWESWDILEKIKERPEGKEVLKVDLDNKLIRGKSNEEGKLDRNN